MKVLVTGGQGYFGTVLCPALIAAGHEVLSVDLGYFRDSWLGPPVEYPNLDADVRDLDESVVAQFDAVVHLAGISNDPIGDLTDYETYTPSLHFTTRLASMAKALDLKFIFASSCSVYGIQEEWANESAETRPQTGYSTNKKEIEDSLLRLSDERFKPLLLRFATLYGFSPRMRFDTVINMLCGMAVAKKEVILNSDGEAWRPFIHINDACNVIKDLIKCSLEIRGPLNVGSDASNSPIIDLARYITHVEGLGHPLTAVNSGKSRDLFADRKIANGKDARNYRVSFQAINSILPSLAFTTLKVGIHRTLKEIKACGFSAADLEHIGFYRLQALELLREKGIIGRGLERTARIQ